MQYKRLKKRHIVYIVILVVWLAACITGYINVNRRFPQPAEDFYSKGDTVEYEGMEITAEELSIWMQPALRAGIRLLVRIIGFVMMISIKTEDGL